MNREVPVALGRRNTTGALDLRQTAMVVVPFATGSATIILLFVSFPFSFVHLSNAFFLTAHYRYLLA
jgi:hypothetical protein